MVVKKGLSIPNVLVLIGLFVALFTAIPASAAVDIPDYIPEYETAPGGNMTGELVKYTTGRTEIEGAYVYQSFADYRVWLCCSFRVTRIYSDETYDTVISTGDPIWIDS